MKLAETVQLAASFLVLSLASFLVQPSQLLLPLNIDLNVGYNGNGRRSKAFGPALEKTIKSKKSSESREYQPHCHSPIISP